MIMPPKPILVPHDKTNAEASAATSAARSGPTKARDVLWMRRAPRISARAIPVRINSGMSRVKSDMVATFTARHLRPEAGPRVRGDKRGHTQDKVRDTRQARPAELV